MDTTYRLKRKLEARDDLDADESAALAGLVAREVTFAPGETIVPHGVPQTVSQLLVSGMAARAKSMPDGRRQITELHVEGDFVDLHSFLLKALEHDVVAMSAVRMALVPHERLKVVTERFPHLTRMLWLTTLIDAAIHREWIVSAGRRSALQQVACLFCEIYSRYETVGLVDSNRCPLPLTQAQLADSCGITTVHANRVVQELRALGLIDWRRGGLTILDFPALAALGGFEPDYLILNHQPR